MKIAKRLSGRAALTAAAAVCLLFILPIASASAAPSPWWKIVTGSRPTNLWEPQGPEGSGGLYLVFTNIGDAPMDATGTPLRITDELPAGMKATGAEGVGGGKNNAGPVDCEVKSATLVSCTFEDVLRPFDSIEVEVAVDLLGTPPVAGAPGKVSVVGGNAPTDSVAQEVKVSPEKTPFGIESFSSRVEEEGGLLDIRAGGHPFQLTTALQFNSGRMRPAPDRNQRQVDQPAQPRNLRFPLPAGLTGNVASLPTCSFEDFSQESEVIEGANRCPDEAAIGVVSLSIFLNGAVGFARPSVPVFNLPPAVGEPARFGFTVANALVIIDTEVDPEDQYRVIAGVNNASQTPQALGAVLAIWGAPGDPRHDSARGWGCVYNIGIGPKRPCERPASLGEDAFLRLPVSCATPMDFGLEAEPWNVPLLSQIVEAGFGGPSMSGCNKVPFDPEVSAAPTGKLAENPSGLSFSVKMPNSGLLNKDAIAEGQPKKVEVTLPEGVTLNPSAAEGLATCSPAQYASEKFNSKPGEGCPDASKIGNVEIDTPLIDENPKGALYVGTPYDNPFNTLLATYIIARIPERGVLVKLPIKISPDPKTGQLIATVDNAPQLPFSSFDLNFREGGRAPLVTPPACGDYDVVAKFTPWSAKDPDNPAPSEVITKTSTFTVQRGVDGGACPSGGVPPFHPEFQAGSINNQAGAHTDFNMRLIRKDGEQDMTKFSTVLPPGVLGSLAGVSKCPASAIAVAKSKSASEELANPSCPGSSLIGKSLAGAGVGSVLTWVGGKVYLGGPLNGDPLSVIAITPAKAGPFDVGTVVVQEALNLNPKTAEVEVDGAASDPIPHILAGIPLKLRDLRIYVDRPNFVINPTSCEEEKTKATLFGSYLDVFSSSDDKPIDLSSRYQAANCANLGFKPNLTLKLKGGTRRGGHPAFTATYTPRKGDANLKDLILRLPRSAFLDQAHIRTICTRVQFAQDNCPKAAQYGYIKATTPLLDEPLQGPVWLRSSSHKLPDLVFDLHGLVDVEVATRIDSVNGGLRASVEDAPDAPISKVVVKMQGAKKGLIVNSRNICGATYRADAAFSGQNGKEFDAKPAMQAQCGGKRKGKKR